jgi:phosphopantetheine attachment domain protein
VKGDKKMNTSEKIIEIIDRVIEDVDVKKLLEITDDLHTLNMNSIIFIKMIIEIEEEFGIEFEDEALNYNRFNSVAMLTEYVDGLMMK